MAEIIADTYELQEQIGAGGGGVVYLGKHLRLNKQVVLKADKRTLTAKPEVLRREVETLKNLSHTCIPQVYDFIEENGAVYTVMDYIDGESLDKRLQRGEKVPQPQLIEWACKLLDALSYLHHRPPYGILHGDIKPANIMETTDGDIRLIDFNIALALGEEGAVRVGFSRGYASPEHYGLDYSSNLTVISQESKHKKTTTAAASMPGNTLSDAQDSSQTPQKKIIMLDVRSDIYSFGATLYHLLTGRKPEWDAKEVVPLDKQECNPAVAAIINKAMQPDPALRYQSADEMLAAFQNLYYNNPSYIWHRRKERITAAVLSLVFAGGCCSTFIGLKRMEKQENAYALAEYSANALQSGDVLQAVDYALQALPEERTVLDPPYTPQAQKALADAVGVYNMADGLKSHMTLNLPSAPLKVSVSPAGKRLAVLYAYEAAIYDLESGAQLATLPAEPSAQSDVVFAGEDILVYAGEGGICAYQITEQREMWKGKPATHIAVSADGSRAASIYKDAEEAFIYNIADGSLASSIEFPGYKQEPNDMSDIRDSNYHILALNADGSKLAASFTNGTAAIFDLEQPDGANDIILDFSGYESFQGGFYDRYFAYSCYSQSEEETTGRGYIAGCVDTEAIESTWEADDSNALSVKTNETGIYIASPHELTQVDPETGKQTVIAYDDENTILNFALGEPYTMLACDNKHYAFYAGGAMIDQGTAETSCDYIAAAGDFAAIGSMESNAVRVLKKVAYPDADLFSYDPAYKHDEARISADGKTVMLFRADQFRLYDINGGLIKEMTLPDTANIYDQQYRRDEKGSYLEVIYYDGTIRTYSAQDGSLRSESKTDPPDPSLYEEFETDKYCITNPLHDAPQVIDKETGKVICELPSEDYLAYVTQVGDQILAEYYSVQEDTGDIDTRYALLLDADFQTVARLPNLCDVYGDKLLFDYPSGVLRQGRIYSIDELITLGKRKRE